MVCEFTGNTSIGCRTTGRHCSVMATTEQGKPSSLSLPRSEIIAVAIIVLALHTSILPTTNRIELISVLQNLKKKQK